MKKKTTVHQYINGQPAPAGTKLEPWMTSFIDNITKNTAVTVVSIHIDRHAAGGGNIHATWE